MTPIVTIPLQEWNEQCPVSVQENALCALEEGSVLFFPQLRFVMEETERYLLSPATAAKSKNVSWDVATGTLSGSSLDETATRTLRAMMQRFASSSKNLVLNLFPRYASSISQARTSFRPVEILGRTRSWRKDDTRLHVDSFPSSPVQDKRILRIFCNINPDGRGRFWRLGESFPSVPGRYVSSLSAPLWGSSQLLRLLRITKSRRTAYDHFMLQLHDRMKTDLDYQSGAKQISYDFPPGSTWMAFTDQVSHAAMSGQHLFEQTFYVLVVSMKDPSRSPLRVLERLTGQTLT
ncbi:MAG TPA: Kdo hydroxylase family protein [Nitrospiraceae bacterium]|nr:Kdo hydroxylase family protein [Nitrospiraceae bacterium]